MFFDAAPVGKAVIVALALGSAWCWVLILDTLISGLRLRAAIRNEYRGVSSRLLASIFAAGVEAAALRIEGESVGERRSRIEDAMLQEARGLITRLEGGLPNLAVISSVAPFVGLFGTVWGIMTSFAGIAVAKDTSIAIVAPGISEALAATAIGLGAAVPASIGYTRIGSYIAHGAQALTTLIERRAISFILEAEPVRQKEAD
jgi:biopolymer transport protein ExbB/TolQ